MRRRGRQHPFGARKSLRTGVSRGLTHILVGGLFLLILAGIIPAARVLTRALQDTAATTSQGSGTPPIEPSAPEHPVGSRTPPTTPPVSPETPEPKLVAAAVSLVRFPSLERLDSRYAEQGLFRVGPQDRVATDFRVGSYNVLGASHTAGPRARPGYGPAAARLPRQIALLEQHGISVAGLQEFQHPQASQLGNLRGSRYQTFPGLSMGPRLAQNSILWRTDTWELLESRTTPIPYFGGSRVLMPHVLLQHRISGRRVWFGNYHNPANIGGDHTKWRREAVRIEASLARRLGADGTPVIMTGDMNDRATFACQFSAQSGMHSPDGARTSQGTCHTPRQMSVDWIFGNDHVQFSNYAADWSSRNRRISDHPLIAASARVGAVSDNPRCVLARSFSGMVRYCPRS